MSELQVYNPNPVMVLQAKEEIRQYVTMRLGGQLFGIPVLVVQDVLKWQKVTRIPLAPSEIAGSLNLRGRIVTAIDMRVRLGLPPYSDMNKTMSVVVEHKGELFSLTVDAVGEVMTLPMNEFAKTPTNISAAWRDIATGIFKLDDELLIIIDIPNILRLS